MEHIHLDIPVAAGVLPPLFLQYLHIAYAVDAKHSHIISVNVKADDDAILKTHIICLYPTIAHRTRHCSTHTDAAPRNASVIVSGDSHLTF